MAVTVPMAAATPEEPSARATTAPQTTTEDLARVAGQDCLRRQPAPALPNSLATAPNSPVSTGAPDPVSAATRLWRSNPAPSGSQVSRGSGAAADAAAGEGDTPSLPDPAADPAAAPAKGSTVPQPPVASLRAPEKPPSKSPLDPMPPTPAAPAEGAPVNAATALRAPEKPPSKGPLDPMPRAPAAAPAEGAPVNAATAEPARLSVARAIQPPLPAEAQDFARSRAQGLGEPVVQSGRENPGEVTELAFGARLVPTAAPAEAPASDPPDPLPAPHTTPARPPVAAGTEGAVPEPAIEAAVAPLGPVTSRPGDTPADSSSSRQPAPRDRGEAVAPERSRKSEMPAPSSWDVSPASPARSSSDAAYAPAARLTDASSQPEHSVAAEPAPPAAAPASPAVPPPSQPPATARNIHLEVNRGNQRVEVRLTERGGEVQVAVRTPDARLASALREDLPTLSSRLAESGFRAETWHPASSGASTEAPAGLGDRSRLPSAGSPPQDPNGRSRQNGGQPQDDPHPQQPNVPEEQSDRKHPGKEFAWLMSSLR